MTDSHEALFLGDIDEATGNFSVDEDLPGKDLLQPSTKPESIIDVISTTTMRPIFDLSLDGAPRSALDIGTPASHGSPNSEEALLNRSSVLFVAISFILLMIISLAWLVFYYVQRFRYLHSKERVSRRLAELAKKAVARIPVKTLQPGDRETNSDVDQCAICIEPYRQLDIIRILPCRHYFHKLCIDPWLLEQRSCPMCKLDILRAYGLRNEFNQSCPTADGASSGSAAGPVIGPGPLSGLTSSTGSDDGLERVALVHSHSRAPSGAGLAYPPLTYVVLTTAADLSSLYYVRPSGSETLPTVSSMERSSFSDSPLNQTVISTLPADSSNASVLPASSGGMVWNPQSDNSTATVLDLVPVQFTASHPHLIDSSIPVPQWPVTVVGVLTSQSAPPTLPVTTASVKNTHPEITHTTQAFRNPVCSIVREHKSTEPPITANPIYGSGYYDYSTSPGAGPTSARIYHTAIPSIDLLHTEPTPPCPVTKPLTNAVPLPSYSSGLLTLAQNPNRSMLSSSNTLVRSSLAPTPAGFRLHAARRNRNSSIARSPFITWLLSPWRRTVVPASTVEHHPDPAMPAVPPFSASQPLLPLALSVDPEPAERCSGSEHVVFAVVETEPFSTSRSANDDPI